MQVQICCIVWNIRALAACKKAAVQFFAQQPFF